MTSLRPPSDASPPPPPPPPRYAYQPPPLPPSPPTAQSSTQAPAPEYVHVDVPPRPPPTAPHEIDLETQHPHSFEPSAPPLPPPAVEQVEFPTKPPPIVTQAQTQARYGNDASASTSASARASIEKLSRGGEGTTAANTKMTMDELPAYVGMFLLGVLLGTVLSVFSFIFNCCMPSLKARPVRRNFFNAGCALGCIANVGLLTSVALRIKKAISEHFR